MHTVLSPLYTSLLISVVDWFHFNVNPDFICIWIWILIQGTFDSVNLIVPIECYANVIHCMVNVSQGLPRSKSTYPKADTAK